MYEQKLEILLENSNSGPSPGYGTNFASEDQIDYYFDLQTQPLNSIVLEQQIDAGNQLSLGDYAHVNTEVNPVAERQYLKFDQPVEFFAFINVKSVSRSSSGH